MMRGALLAAFGLIITLRVSAAQRVEAGLVDSMAGPRGGIRVLREGRWEDLARLTPLYAGDSVSATDRRAMVRIRLYGRGVEWVCGEPRGKLPCPLTLKVPAPPRGGLSDGIRALVHKVLGSIFGGEEWSRKVSAMSRGSDDIEVPLLGTSQELGAGNRDLEVAWQGGESPFSVQVVNEGSGQITTVTGVNKHAVSLGRVELVPGEYGLRIEDSRGTVRQIRFTVVPRTMLPSPPTTYRSDKLSGGAQLLLTSAWLAGKTEGRWTWEAFLRLSTLRGDRTAERMRAELTAGRLPPGN